MKKIINIELAKKNLEYFIGRIRFEISTDLPMVKEEPDNYVSEYQIRIYGHTQDKVIVIGNARVFYIRNDDAVVNGFPIFHVMDAHSQALL